jgi:hypothetical protein
VILMMFFLFLGLLLPFLRLDLPANQGSMMERIGSVFQGVFQCLGVGFGLLCLLTIWDLIKRKAAQYHYRRVEHKLARLEPLVRDSQSHATPTDLAQVIKLLYDGNDTVRQQALNAGFALLRAGPHLPISTDTRQAFLHALLLSPGFARALIESGPQDDLLNWVTLGAKLGAGTSEKRLAPVTSDPVELARWVQEHRRDELNPEIQVSIGYDTGPMPYLMERSRFVALYLYISTTDLKRFQALLRRPPRDPNAAYGLVIRGDVVEVKAPGQARGHRLDYVFPFPVRLSEANLAGLFREIQLLNLGLLVTSVADTCRVLLGGQSPSWLDERRRTISRWYSDFEQQLVALLRCHDAFRDPTQIHRLVACDHGERVRSLSIYRLEECLYPYYSWVVPLYDPDTRWERLLSPLRGIEAMLLHQGEVEGREVTRGVDFIQQVRRLGYETAARIEQTLKGELAAPPAGSAPLDPFIDAAHQEATVWYLNQVTQALTRREVGLESVPDPSTFRHAVRYYQIEASTSRAVVHPSEPEVES